MRRPILALLVATGLPLPAFAGPVSQAARGVESKQESHESSDSAPPPDDDDDDRRVEHEDDDDGCSSCGVSVLLSDDDTGSPDTRRATIELEGPTRFDAYLGAHAVVGSDGAGVLDLRLHRDFVGLSFSGTSYFEQVSDEKGRMDSVRLDMWAASLAGRLARAGGTSVWIEGGMAASTSTEYDGIVGLQGGMRLQVELRPQLELSGRARFYGLEHDVSAFEAWGGVRAGFLAVGYRSLQFNFGPALHGPEAGLAVSF